MAWLEDEGRLDPREIANAVLIEDVPEMNEDGPEEPTPLPESYEGFA